LLGSLVFFQQGSLPINTDRAQVARVPALSDGVDLDQHDPGLYRPAHPGAAAVVL